MKGATVQFLRVVEPDTLTDPARFEPASGSAHPGIVKQLSDGYYLAALEYVLEADEDTQYPMEDVLDEFTVHIEMFEVAPSAVPGGQIDVFASSDLEGIETMISRVVGHRAYNREGSDGIVLVIE